MLPEPCWEGRARGGRLFRSPHQRVWKINVLRRQTGAKVEASSSPTQSSCISATLQRPAVQGSAQGWFPSETKHSSSFQRANSTSILFISALPCQNLQRDLWLVSASINFCFMVSFSLVTTFILLKSQSNALKIFFRHISNLGQQSRRRIHREE